MTAARLRLGSDAPAAHRVAAALAARGIRGKNRYWPLAERLGEAPRWARVQLGATELLIDRSDASERQIYECWHQRDVRTWLAACCREGGTVIDVGANVGLMSATAAAAVGLSGTVLAFEPAPTLVGRLRPNVSPLRQVKVHAFGLGSTETTKTLHVPRADSGSASLWSDYVDAPSDTVTVEIRRLDDVIPRDVGEVDVLKIDVEGYEAEVLAGARELLRSEIVRNVILEWSNWGPLDRRDWPTHLMADLGDRYVWHRIVHEKRTALGSRLTPALAPFRPGDATDVTNCDLLVSRAD